MTGPSPPKIGVGAGLGSPPQESIKTKKAGAATAHSFEVKRNDSDIESV